MVPSTEEEELNSYLGRCLLGNGPYLPEPGPDYLCPDYNEHQNQLPVMSILIPLQQAEKNPEK